MPLDADFPGIAGGSVGTLDGFDDAIGTGCNDAVYRAYATHGLLMEAVHTDFLAAKDAGQSARRFDSDRMSSIGWESMAIGFRAVGRKVGIEDPVSESCDQLHAVADTENRDVSSARRFYECFVECELFGRYDIELGIAGQCSVGGKVVAARNQQAVERFHDPAWIALNRQLERDAAGAVDGRCVAAIDVVVGAAFTPASTVVERERDSDLRSVHGASIAI